MKTILLIIALLSTIAATAQSVVGMWKRTNTMIASKDGKITDAQVMMETSMPCSTQITYEFKANGIQKSNIPAECRKRMAKFEKLNADMRYTVKGNKITVLSPDAKLAPDATYDLTIKGNIMTWVVDYEANPTISNPGNAKSITLVFKRL